jgi:hypothetical protein
MTANGSNREVSAEGERLAKLCGAAHRRALLLAEIEAARQRSERIEADDLLPYLVTQIVVKPLTMIDDANSQE